MKIFKILLFVLSGCMITQAQPVENTYTWGAFNHSCWKIQPNLPTGYVMMGNKFFQTSNTIIYAQGINESGISLWLRKHVADGFSQLQTFWKSFIMVHSNPARYFAVVAGSNSGNKAYALLIDQNGNKIWDRVSTIPNGMEFGGVNNAIGAGWVAAGSIGGQLIFVKFNPFGEITIIKELHIQNSYGWSIIQSGDGGYILAGTRWVVKVDDVGNIIWRIQINLPISPDASEYFYTEFEEIVPLPAGEDGYIVVGSAFSSYTSATYTIRISSDGKQQWANIHHPRNTSDPGTPVSWSCSVIIDGQLATTCWRSGPVSTGGTLYIQRQDFKGTKLYGETSLGNSISVQEAFIIKPHGKYVIGGTRGSYSKAYSYINAYLPLIASRSDREDLYIEPNMLSGKVRLNFNNTKPLYKYPVASRVFNSELRVFPNPSTGIINVGGKIQPGATIRVTDMMGRLMLEQPTRSSDQLLELDLTGKGKGMYNVEMVSANQLVTKKVMIH